MFRVKIITPEKVVFDALTYMAVLPGSEGDFGLLVRHAPLMAVLKSGILSIYEEASAVNKKGFFVSGGFANMVEDVCTVLADEAMPLQEITQEMVAKRLADAQNALDMAASPYEIQEAQRLLDIATALQNILSAEGIKRVA